MNATGVRVMSEWPVGVVGVLGVIGALGWSGAVGGLARGEPTHLLCEVAPVISVCVDEGWPGLDPDKARGDRTAPDTMPDVVQTATSGVVVIGWGVAPGGKEWRADWPGLTQEGR
jgi:hypothetical protein